MPVTANTVETFDVTTIREDLSDAENMISPMDTPFVTTIGRRKATSTYVEWPVVALAAVDTSNRVAEGEASPAADAPTLGVRQGNYTQTSDKVVIVSDVSDAVNGAADIQTIKQQIAYKLAEFKRDKEAMLLNNVAASAGSSGVAAVAAGLPAFLRTNADRGAGGADGTTSGAGSAGYPNAAATDGTQRELTEALLKSVIADCWTEGAKPTVVMCGALAKQKISTFSGNVTRYQQADENTLNTAFDVYMSDFGRLKVIPNRFQRARDVFVLDPEYAALAELIPTKQKPLARTGHAEQRLISGTYTLEVGNEAAHGIIADIDPAL